MKPTIKLDKFLTSTALSTSIFIGSGCYKTYKDYKNASPEYKDKFLIKDSVILSGAALGMLANQSLNNKISKSNIYKSLVSKLSKKFEESAMNKKIKTSITYTREIAKEIISGLTTTAAGILGALGTDYLLSKTKFEQPKQTPIIEHKDENEKKLIEIQQLNELESQFETQLEKLTDEETVDVFYSSMTELPKLKFIGAGMIGADAIDISKNKEFDDKLKHTAGYLVNDTLVPLLFLSTGSALTQNMKAKFRIPTVFASLFLGTLATHKLFDKYAKSDSIVSL